MLEIVCMSTRNIKNLPLLEAFDAIMTRGSISDAAEYMSVTQSAVSKQLGQLRDWLDDELFVRTSDGMQPTPRANEMHPQVQAILEQAIGLTKPDNPQPRGFTGKFVLSTTDELVDRVIPLLVNRIAVEAPDLRLITLPLARDYLVRQLEAGQVNLVVAVNWQAPELLKQTKLGSDPFVCVMHKDHALARGSMTVKRYASATHVLVAPLGGEMGVVDFELAKLGLERHICASLSAFNMINEALLGTERITTVPSRVARRLVESGPYVTKRVPVTLPPSNYYALWHPRFNAEPRLRWMLNEVQQAFSDSR
jgi:DNA-binding transcriptional LysR family regulator